ncbi:MAG: cation diffusion facilitator family transporter [Rudaea sp.]|nr:cation diffusion facilitator family transporter [Rudaea sp.]
MSAPLTSLQSHGHAHAGARRLLLAFALTTLAMAAEAIGGWVSGSLALLADAGHMLVDTFALLLAWAGAHFARRPADALRSFGYARLEVLVGYTNALAQFVLVVWIVVEAIARLQSPAPILPGIMLAIAVAGLLINLLVLFALGHHEHDDLNAAGARLHVLGDLLGSLGAVMAALVISRLGWLWADAAISILVSLLILGSAWKLLRRSAHILLEGTPEGVESARVAETVLRESGVGDVHHVHVWQLAGGRRIATLHARLVEGSDANAVLVSIQYVLREHFHIAHATVQLEHSDCAMDDCHAHEHDHEHQHGHVH